MTKYLCYNLKHLRESYGLTQLQLSSFLGISPQLYNRYETKRQAPSLKALYTLAALYDIAPYILLRHQVLLPERFTFFPVPKLPRSQKVVPNMNDLYTNLRHNLCALRQSCDLSQADIAKRLFITTASYGHYETGRRKPNLEMLCAISDIYQVTIQELLDERL